MMRVRLLISALVVGVVAVTAGADVLAPQPQTLPSPSTVAVPPEISPTPQPSPIASPSPTTAPTPERTATPTVIARAAEPADGIWPERSAAWPALPLASPTPASDGTGAGSGNSGWATVPADGRPTRVVFASLGIDLPIVPGDLVVRGNPNFYPRCDVAQYMMEFGQPGQLGTTYIYAHAQSGMFLPMLRASRRSNGAEIIGARVDIYTSDAKRHVYEIFRVKRHSLNLNIAYNVQRGEHRLILQTSEGPPGHRPVLQVAARPVRVLDATAAEAMPRPKPRVCWPGR